MDILQEFLSMLVIVMECIYDLGLSNLEDYVIDSAHNLYTVDGFDVFEKVGSEYIYLAPGVMEGAAVVGVEAGTQKTLVAITYILNNNEEKVYSDYSNELVIAPPVYTPTLGYAMGSYGDDIIYLVNIVSAGGVYAEAVSTEEISGYELYEKNGDDLTLVDTNETTFNTEITLDVGERKIYVARVYALNSTGEKVYSDYSNELILERVATE